MCTLFLTIFTRCGCRHVHDTDFCHSWTRLRDRNGVCYKRLERMVGTDNDKVCPVCLDDLVKSIRQMRDKRGMVKPN